MTTIQLNTIKQAMLLRENSYSLNMATPSATQSIESLYEFRPLTKDNLTNVRSLHDELLPIKYSDNFYKALLNGIYKSLLLYQRDGDVLIGVSSWKIEKRNLDDNDPEKKIQIAYLATFGIRNNFRRKGLGKYLLLSSFSTMQDQTCKLCELHVLSSNYAAKNLYVKCGFKVKLKLPNHYHFNDQLHDAFLLIKSLKSIKNADIEMTDYDDEEEESQSIEYKKEQERSPPYYQQSDSNLELNESYIKPDRGRSMASLERETLIDIDQTATELPISNWIGSHVDSLWIKCVVL